MSTRTILTTKLIIVTALFFSLISARLCTGQRQVDNSRLYKLDLNGNQEKQKNIQELSSSLITIDESNPGVPALPSRTYYFAIPPSTKVNADLLNIKFDKIENFELEINPKVILVGDSSLSYSEEVLHEEIRNMKSFPAAYQEILGYTWIRDFYCVVVKVNTHIFNFYDRSLTIIKEADIMLSWASSPNYSINYSPKGPFDEDLKDVISNFQDAMQLRTFNHFEELKINTDNWIDYSKEYIKLLITTDGIHRVNYNDLLSYGVNPSFVNPKTIKIFLKGEEKLIFVQGEDDLIFDSTDFIEFYTERNYDSTSYRQIVLSGQDYFNYMNRYSDTSVVWLSWGGTNGKRCSRQSSVMPQTTDTLSSHLVRLHFERDMRLWYYDAVLPRVQLPFWQENKVWTWLVIGSSGSQSITFSARDAVANSPLKTFIRLISNASNIITDAHKNGISINSSIPQDTIKYNYKQTVNFNSSLNSNLLVNGNNTIRIFGIPTSASFHQSLLDWIDIEYFRMNKAVNDSLLVIIPDSVTYGLRVIKVEDITSEHSNLLVYKLKPEIKRIENFSLSSGTSKILTFTDTACGGDRYLIIKSDFIRKPVFRYKKYFVNLTDPSRGADYVLVTNNIFTSSATNYKNFIINQYGLRTELVFTDDIFDEFSFGMVSAEAIRLFLKKANYYWTAPKPSYLALIGDANYDYRDVIEPVPLPRKKNLVTSYGNPVSDLWYVTWDTTNVNLPQMYVGRIPVNTNDELNNYLLKHKRFVEKPLNDWNKYYMLFSGGDASKPSELAQIKATNEDLFQNLIKPAPVGGVGKHFYKTISPPTNFGPYTQEEIRETIDKGAVFISYIGHSGTRVWDNGITEVEHIQNKYSNRNPLITDFGCSTGKFAESDVDAFGELFVAQSANGQAIAYLGNSSWGYLSTSLRFPKYFYSLLLNDSIKIIGRAHFLAKVRQFNETGINDVNRVFNFCNLLFGDPIISLKIPSKPNFSIGANSISIVGDFPRDTDDSVKIKIHVRNLGSVPDSVLSVDVSDKFKDSIVFNKKIVIEVPLFENQLSFNIPIKGLVGKHFLKIELDKENVYEELDETDNISNFSFDVYSTSLLALESENYYSTYKGELRFLNPALKTESISDRVELSLSQDKDFGSFISLDQSLDTLFTTVSLPSMQFNKRYWWRMKLNFSGSDWSRSYSFMNLNKPYAWYIDKTFEPQNIEYQNTIFDSSLGGWILSSEEKKLRIYSAGQSAGSIASMQYNAIEMLPNTYFWGIATALVDTITLKPHSFKYFLYPNPPSGDSLTSYINSLQVGTMIALAICDDGAQSVLGWSGGTPVRNAIKTLGSYYIDSIRYRESWAILGRKGAPIGSVPESYKKLFEGPALIDVSKIIKSDSGIVVFPPLGSSAKWEKINVDILKPAETFIDFYPLGIRVDGSVDTLQKLNFTGDSSSISFINAKLYPQLKLLTKLYANAHRESPSIKSIGIDYKIPAELAINYQTVSASKDTIMQGDSLFLNLFTQNVGGFDADSFRILLSLIKNDNTKILLRDSLIMKLRSMERLNISHIYRNYLPDGKGNMFFQIELDPDNIFLELYKTNNTFRVPFFVKSDTNLTSVNNFSLNVLYDGKSIDDGAFVTDNPKINVEFSYPIWFPAADTNSIQFYLNGNRISISDLTINYDTSKRKIYFQYIPKLTTGDYIFKIFGKNILGHLETSPGYEKYFKVSSQIQLLQVYNYPNPFQNETFFTFNLTQVPDELRIKIYTISGRLIKEISKNSSELSTNFNKIYWDGRDTDGDLIGNGVYLYKVIAKRSDRTVEILQKLAKVR